MSNKKSIVFLGDSFTWGEGLELYADTPKWISERTLDNSTWANSLKDKQDKEGTEFRNKNRFPALACKELDYDFFVDYENGGTVGRNLLILEENLIKNKVTDVVLQFSSYSREPYHLTYDCRCEYCEYTHWSAILDNVASFLYKQNNFRKEEITDMEKFITNFISKKINVSNVKSIEFLEKVDNYCKHHFDNQLNLLNTGFFNRLRSMYKVNIYFIDSWCSETSNILQNNNHITPFLLPLIGKTGKTYKKWSEWLQTFENKSIKDDFPLSGNHHPTLEMHQYLSMSVINHFNSFKQNII